MGKLSHIPWCSVSFASLRKLRWSFCIFESFIPLGLNEHAGTRPRGSIQTRRLVDSLGTLPDALKAKIQRQRALETVSPKSCAASDRLWLSLYSPHRWDFLCTLWWLVFGGPGGFHCLLLTFEPMTWWSAFFEQLYITGLMNELLIWSEFGFYSTFKKWTCRTNLGPCAC